MKIPPMKIMRLDTLQTKNGLLHILVNQENNGIYWAQIFDSKKKLKKVYQDFKYRFDNWEYLQFWIPSGYVNKVINLKNKTYRHF